MKHIIKRIQYVKMFRGGSRLLVRGASGVLTPGGA